MSKHIHIQSLAEQILKKGHGNAPFHFEKSTDQTSKPIEVSEPKTKMLVDDIEIQQLAYQIFQEKGGSDLDNWFEAERTLSSNY